MSNITLSTIEHRRAEVSEARRRLRIYNSIAITKKGMDLELEYELWEIGQITSWFCVFFIITSWIMVHNAYLGEYSKWGHNLDDCNANHTTTITAKFFSRKHRCLTENQVRVVNFEMIIAKMCSGIISGISTDIFGRLAVYRFMVVFHFVASIILVFANTILTIYLCWAVLAFSTFSIIIACFTLLIDYCSLQTRCLCGFIFYAFQGIGFSFLGWILYHTEDWQVIQSVWLATELPLLFGLWFLPESARLAYGNQQYTFCWYLIRKINKLGQRNDIEDYQEKRTCVQKLGAQFKFPTSTFQNCEFIKRIICLCIPILLVNSSVTYGVSKDLRTETTTELYAYELILAIIELFTYLSVTIVFINAGRKLSTIISFVLIAFLYLITYFLINGDAQPKAFFIVMGRMFMNCAIAGLFVWTAELFPTVARGTVVGLLLFFEGLGALLVDVSPLEYCLNCFGLLKSERGTIFIFSVVSLFVLMLVPPTRNRILVDTQEDANELVLKNNESTGFRSIQKCL